ncbi:sigma-E factor negative regulatory protein [Rhodanobacter sp. AS-Z3]|uniref:sigma-E factor negative regulatory protein n=1 Tax=Rhodanobacter sp. AS-Z3 TaxID=3031330 RepID=UPI002479A229|nr:sigma-E factor negative regulatory protein [Rhodanobacter sp. AS-Z3]WEN13989.1 sigma-E factor negative regulatory protein [Rhodanobacter sp. AS-Z3]
MKQAGMNQNTRENLSAGIDGELSKEQLRFLLRSLDHDASLQQDWARYHTARDSLRHELPALASSGFAARVMLAIEQEPVVTGMAPARHRHWLRWSAGGAIAASVAAAALMVAQPRADTSSLDQVAASTSVQQTQAVAGVAPASQPVAPAAVPPWLSGNSAGLLSQQASATLGSPFDQSQPVYARRLSGYPSMPRYRTLENNDGSYLLLLDPQQRVPARLPGTSAVAQ